MGKLALCGAAAVALAIATIPASADHNAGPMRNGGQCWHASPGPHANTGFGYWEPCPAAASPDRSVLLHRPLRARRDPHNDR
jgi:hypothetical protein